MMRATSLLLILALGSGACASGGSSSSGRDTVKKVLIGIAVGSAALAIGSAVGGHAAQNSLQDDLVSKPLSGSDYVSADEAGIRWNRMARASLFVSGLSLIGMGVLWEAGVGDAIRQGSIEHRPAGNEKPIFPVPGASSSGRVPTVSGLGYSWATAK